MTALHHWYKHYDLLIFDDIDSTNEEAKRLIQSCISGDFVIWAKKQTAGHGRYGREWVSPEGNLFFSLLLMLDHEMRTASQLVFITAIAVGEALRACLPASCVVSCKWPNDVLVNGKKIAGILLETVMGAQTERVQKIVIGIGVNVAHFPEGMETPATSLAKEGAQLLSVDQVLDKIMNSFSYWYDMWETQGFGIIRENWLKVAANLGKVVTACTGKERISGVFNGISEEGCLMLTLAGGQEYLMSAGEVFFQQVDKDVTSD